nr:unnamed protein product [Callosobruchus analis]
MSLKELIRNRSSMKQKLLLLEKFISTIKTSDSDNKPSLTEIEIRFKDHECMLSEFDKIQSMIESKCSEEHLEEHYLEREEFQERYYVSQQFLSDYLKNAFGNASPNQSQINSNQPQSNSSGHFDPLQNMLLPKIKLPTFTGEFQHWTSFKTSFMATILNNVYLNDNQRFQFLKVSLQGYALRLIEGLENVVNPFEKAWQQLCDRFDKKHFILDSHFKSLLGLQSLQRENYSSFRTLLDEVSKHLTALDGLGVTKEELFDSFLIHVISSKLDKNTLRVWKEQKHNSELPSLDEFMNFLKDKSDILQSLDASDQKVSTSNKFHQQANRSTCNVSVTANKQLKCNYCKKEHTIYKCTEFLALSVDERIKKVKGHDVSKCRLSTCSICKNKHNTLLHKDSKARDNSETQASVGSVETHVHHVSMQQQPSIDASKSDQVLLSTIMCKIKDVKGNLHDCRALLDCGAQTNLITEKLCRTLNIPLESTNVSLVGFNQAKSHLDKKCSIKLISNYNNYQCDISCLVVPIITCNIPPHHFNISQLGIPSNIALSDPSFECPRDVDILLGASIFWDLLLSGKIHLGKNMPSLRNTQFGWIITGTIPIQNNISVCNLATVHISEDDQLKKFWELEEVKSIPQYSSDDMACEALFKKDTHRLETDNLLFISLEKKFSNETFKTLYTDFIHEYQALGHMTVVPNDTEENSYFLPHHGVLKESNACKTILKDMYVDDLLSGSNDLMELKSRCQDIYTILKSANFILRKWNSNNNDVISNFSNSTIENSVLNIGDQTGCSTLGIQWINTSDMLKYKIRDLSSDNNITKRYFIQITLLTNV